MKYFVLLILAVSSAALHHDKWWSCYNDPVNSEFYVEAGLNDSSIAWGFFNDTIEDLGYGFLEVYTNGDYSDELQTFAAGFLEGYITHKRIDQSWRNFWDSTFYNSTPTFLKHLFEFIDLNVLYTYENAMKNAPSDPYWYQVNLVAEQFSGIYRGYNNAVNDSAPEKRLTFEQLYLLNMMGDLDDLIPAITYIHSIPEFGEFKFNSIDDQLRWGILNGHCSSLVKPVNNFTELFAAHDMWSDFSQMLEIYKYYNFQLDSGAAAYQVSFSSYPGLISSEDDFYVTSNGLVVMETTNGIYNLSLYEAITPNSLMYWFRVIIANRIASNGSYWTETMAKYNSGTYNNQWIIVDYNLFEKGNPTQPDGLLWIGSQIPGLFERADVTSVLNSQGYWPSYNIPYFENIYRLAGYDQMVAQYGDFMSYSMCPRAQIFRDRAPLVNTIEDLQELMRYNDWEHDPLSLYCPLNQIASRLDLAPANTSSPMCTPATFGAINAKITQDSFVPDLKAWIIAGPTSETLPPFMWSTEIESAFPNSPHHGHPYIFNFGWVLADLGTQ